MTPLAPRSITKLLERELRGLAICTGERVNIRFVCTISTTKVTALVERDLGLGQFDTESVVHDHEEVIVSGEHVFFLPPMIHSTTN
jgi:hypothetical protein